MLDAMHERFNGILPLLAEYVPTIAFSTVMTTSFTYIFYRHEYSACSITAFSLFSAGTTLLTMIITRRKEIQHKHLIVITGCDSGLGYSLAMHCCDNLNARVLAGVLDPAGFGASQLKQNGITTCHLDLTDRASIAKFHEKVNHLLEENHLELYAFVNNAAVMMFGEFEWFTENQLKMHIEINLLGTMRVTQALLPIIRKHGSRIIVIGSHCAEESLPGLSLYGATKAGLLAWATSLRLELNKYNIRVISFVPGSFVNESSIMAKQAEHFDEMEKQMSGEVKRFYDPYFSEFRQYFSSIGGDNSPRLLTNPRIYKTFEDTLLDVHPRAVYKCQPWRYFFYFTMFKIMPIWIRDKLIYKFVGIPRSR